MYRPNALRRGRDLGTTMTDLIATALHAPFRSFEEATQHLHDTAGRAEVKNLSYWYLNFAGGNHDDVVWIATYDSAYMSAYMNEYTPLGDPDMNDLLELGTVIDWADSVRSNAICRRLYKTASRFGISKHGVSFAFRDANMGTIIFSVNVDHAGADWDFQKTLLVERFKPFAHEFHARMRPLLLLSQKDQTQFSLCA